MAWNDLTPQQVQQELQDVADLKIIDVRSPAEHQHHRMAGATLIPMQEIPTRMQELNPSAAYLIYCEHGVRSHQVCDFLTANGFGDLRALQGGLANWMESGLPVES